MYIDYASYIKEKFGTRVQKIALNPGLGCPNRDGKIGWHGCTYCNNQAFSPFYGKAFVPIRTQLEQGINFFSHKYKCNKFIAYFQAYTNTYADIKTLENIYNQALENENVIGLAVATRPDCIDDNILKLLQKISSQYYTVLELGVESCCDNTLKFINRGHTFAQAENAIKKAYDFGLDICAHLIMYLPGETEEMMLKTAEIMSSLPIKMQKLHQLQIIKGTKMEQQYYNNPELFRLPTAEEYVDFIVEYIAKSRKDMIFERFISESPMDMVIAPKWNGLKSFQIANMIKSKL